MGALLAELVPGGAAQSAGNGAPATGRRGPGRARGARTETRTRRRPPPAPAAEAPEPAPAPPAAAPAPAGDGVLMPIVLPDMESVTEGVVVEWRVAVGDAVAADQIVVEVSTDKVDLEVPAPAAGRLVSIDVEAGGTFSVGQPLGEIAAGRRRARPAVPAVVRKRSRRPGGRRAPAPAAPAAPPGPPAADAEWPAITPVARRLALEKGVDPAVLTGTGPGGIIRKPDVLAAAGAAAPRAAAPPRRRPFRSAPARRRSPCAARPPRSPATWTRACRSRPPPASARSPSPSSTPSGARSTSS